jgi:hypothetical protein
MNGDDGDLTPSSVSPDPGHPQVSPPSGRHPHDEPRPFKPTPVSGDVILPLMIYSVVKSNPPHLLSHLLYTQRFRNESFGGEESYCLINLLAAAEFLENVDLAALGLQAEGVNTSDLTPLPVARSRSASVGSVDGTLPIPATTGFGSGAATRLRGRVEQQVDAIAGSANKVLSGVVDSSFGVLRALLPGGHQDQNASQPPEVITQETKPGFTLLKRETGFSIATLAASLPIARQRSNQSNTTADESGQQMMDVSRPNSRMSKHSRVDGAEGEIRESSEESEEGSEGGEEEEEEEHDARSIKSFESMMSQRRRKRRRAAIGRKSIADRLANVPGLQKLSHALDPKPDSDSKVVITPSASHPLSQSCFANLNLRVYSLFLQRPLWSRGTGTRPRCRRERLHQLPRESRHPFNGSWNVAMKIFGFRRSGIYCGSIGGWSRGCVLWVVSKNDKTPVPCAPPPCPLATLGPHRFIFHLLLHCYLVFLDVTLCWTRIIQPDGNALLFHKRTSTA